MIISILDVVGLVVVSSVVCSVFAFVAGFGLGWKRGRK